MGLPGALPVEAAHRPVLPPAAGAGAVEGACTLTIVDNPHSSPRGPCFEILLFQTSKGQFREIIQLAQDWLVPKLDSNSVLPYSQLGS